jgi:hypothetical protein
MKGTHMRAGERAQFDFRRLIVLERVDSNGIRVKFGPVQAKEGL